MTLMRHSTPDLTVNRYAKSRRENPANLTEAVGEIACAGMEGESNCATSVPPKVVGLASDQKIRNFMVEDKGVEPSASAMRVLRSPN